LDVGVCYSFTDPRFLCYISLSTIWSAHGNGNLFGTNRTKNWFRNWKSVGRVLTVWISTPAPHVSCQRRLFLVVACFYEQLRKNATPASRFLKYSVRNRRFLKYSVRNQPVQGTKCTFSRHYLTGLATPNKPDHDINARTWIPASESWKKMHFWKLTLDPLFMQKRWIPYTSTICLGRVVHRIHCDSIRSIRLNSYWLWYWTSFISIRVPAWGQGDPQR